MKSEGNEMTQEVLRSNGTVVSRRTYHRLTIAECNSQSEVTKRKMFDNCVNEKLGDSISIVDNASSPKVEDSPNIKDFNNDDDGGKHPIQLPEEDPVDANG